MCIGRDGQIGVNINDAFNGWFIGLPLELYL